MTSYGGTISFLWVGPVCCSFLAPISLWGVGSQVQPL
ncbi:hypothetical protein Ahy_A03g013529 isoform B [Arachis hypogaea]|nr:hypothetical protein Ahy_A03g013529 isoform B [Arachis hypogaea]